MQERLFAAEKAAEERSGCHRQQIARLEAALAGAEAARQQLEAQGAAKSSTDSGDARAAAATLAEAEARAGALQSQIDTLRSHAAASQSGLQEEVQSLRVRTQPLSGYFRETSNTACRLLPQIAETLHCRSLPMQLPTFCNEGRDEVDLCETQKSLCCAC